MNVLKKPGFKTFPKYVLMFKKGSHAYFMSHFTQGIINLFFFILISKLWTMSILQVLVLVGGGGAAGE